MCSSCCALQLLQLAGMGKFGAEVAYVPGEEPCGAPGHFDLAFWQSNRSAKMLAQRCWESGYCTKSSCNVSTDQQ